MMKDRRILIICVLGLGLTLAWLMGLTARSGTPAQAQGDRPGPSGLLAPQAPLGTAFTYQGQLKQSGNPVNGTCDFQFGLWNAASGGTQIGTTQTKTNVSVTNGLSTIPNLDFGGGAFTGDARWLAIAVRCPAGSGSYSTLDPRQALMPAPYALALPGLWTQQNANSPNLIGGYSGNSVTVGPIGATISGGGMSSNPNRVTASFGTIGGGLGNTASGEFVTIGGGGYNTASGYVATVGGGYVNTASGAYATVGGGHSNIVTATYGTIGGGNNITVTGESATVGGGDGNTASGPQATVGGGDGNTARGRQATVGGGVDNTASGPQATVGGGDRNTASGDSATVGGGAVNTASGYYATVPGGSFNTASGAYSFAAGHRAKAIHDGSFVLADSSAGDFESVRADSLRARFNGGATFVVNTTYDDWVRFWTTGNHLIDTSTGAALSLSGYWLDVSDRENKENFAPADGQQVLARLAQLPITTWNYKVEDSSVHHMGPVSQDFYTAFGLGEDDKHIGTVDADGVALAAIQALYRRNQALEAENAAQQEQIADLAARVAALEQGVNAKESPLLSALAWLFGGLLLAGLVLGRRWRAGGGQP
jgi:hypothetical protein